MVWWKCTGIFTISRFIYIFHASRSRLKWLGYIADIWICHHKQILQVQRGAHLKPGGWVAVSSRNWNLKLTYALGLYKKCFLRTFHLHCTPTRPKQIFFFMHSIFYSSLMLLLLLFISLRFWLKFSSYLYSFTTLSNCKRRNLLLLDLKAILRHSFA